MKFCFIACFTNLFFEDETMAALGNKSRSVTMFVMQNGIIVGAEVEIPLDNSGSHINNMSKLIMPFLKKEDEDGVVKKEDKDEDGVVKNFEERAVQTVKNFQSAVQTFAAASNATSNADVERIAATIAAIRSDDNID